MNQISYGTFTPPLYNLSAIRTPVHLYYGDNDWLSTPEDVRRLSTELKSLVLMHRAPNDKFNHIDFVYAIDVKILLYDFMISAMAKLN
jgi:lysosomal acid lipase/cholesteryl ester hydrolase